MQNYTTVGQRPRVWHVHKNDRLNIRYLQMIFSGAGMTAYAILRESRKPFFRSACLKSELLWEKSGSTTCNVDTVQQSATAQLLLSTEDFPQGQA